MGEEREHVEGNFLMRMRVRFWGLRPWKRHSLILTVGGLLYALVGLQYILTAPRRSREIALEIVLRVAPLEFWGSVFLFAGLLSMISSRWPPFAETWGYMVLTGLSTGWSATYLLGILFFESPVTNSTQVFLWGGLGFMWWAISGLLNPDHTAVTNHAGR